MRVKSSTNTIKEARLWGRRPQDIEIDNRHGYHAELVEQLRSLLVGLTASDDTVVRPDPHRPGLYDLEASDRVMYIYVSPASGKVLLLASWSKEGADELAVQLTGMKSTEARFGGEQ